MHRFRRVLTNLIVLLPLLILGCGDGGGNELASGGIGGSGNLDTSAGVVASLGSITVNGVTFDTDTAEVIIDDAAAPDDSGLRVGMVVEVRGTINADRISGTAKRVEVNTAVIGAIESIDATTLVVLGQTITVDTQTRFDEASIVPPTIDGLGVSDLVRVSGQFSSDGMIRATRIEKIDTGDTTRSVTGFVTNLTPTTFTLGSLVVDFSDAELEDFEGNPLAAGDYVEVRGQLTGGSTLVAENVELEDQEFDDDRFAEIEGIIITADDPQFTLVSAVGPVTFQIDTLTLFDEGSPADLVVGAEVEVEGSFSNNLLEAEIIEVEIEDEDDDDEDGGDGDLDNVDS